MCTARLPIRMGSVFFLILFSILSSPVFATSSEKIDHFLQSKGYASAGTSGRVLFILPFMVMGGIDRAFLDTVKMLPLPKDQFDVCIMRPGGVFERLLGHDVRVIPYEQAQRQRYSAVISYNHSLDMGLWVDKIRAEKRIQWIHTDLNSYGKSWLFSKKNYRSKIDFFVGVSKRVTRSFQKFYPREAKRAKTIYNVVDVDRIRALAAQSQKEISSTSRTVNVVTVCRIGKEKAIDRAIRVHKRLDKEGIRFRWYIVGSGDGVLEKQLRDQVSKSGLVDKFIFLGGKENPYPYMKAAHIFVLPSLFEGCSLVISEAQILGVPIIATDVGGAREQIRAGSNGLIVGNNEEAIYQGLKRLLLDAQLRDTFSSALKGYAYKNTPILKSLLRLCVARDTHTKRAVARKATTVVKR